MPAMTSATTSAARPAVFDRTTQHRRAMIGKINIARHQLAMDEDDYRQLLLDSTGKISLRECDDRHLERMITALKGKGFKPIPSPGRAPRPGQKARLVPPTMHPMARKARALWISLYHLGVVHNAAEEALEAFAKRQLGCERMVWARQGDAYKLIEALKAMAERAGWRQRDMNGKPLSPLVLNSHLCEVILARLRDIGVAADVWSLEQAAFRLCGEEFGAPIQEAIANGPYTAERYHRLAAALGAKLREALPNVATAEDDAS